MTDDKCPKCKNAMQFTRIISDYTDEVMVTIELECKPCEYQDWPGISREELLKALK